MKLQDIELSSKSGVYVIAEIGINHGGNLDTAKKLIEEAAKAGANSVKFQTYVTEKRVAKDSPIFGILKQCELPLSAFAQLKSVADGLGVDFFSTPFDTESVACLNELNCKIFKIASFDLVNQKLLREVASTGKTVIMSTGMSDRANIDTALNVLRQGTKRIALLHCISAYPTAEKDANLGAVATLQDLYPDIVIGQSDHTADIFVPSLAVAAGAQILEKHFMLENDSSCVDAPVSIRPSQMKALVEQAARIRTILGEGRIGSTEAQKPIEQYRRFSTL